jgi:Tol biopolymer transport system component
MEEAMRYIALLACGLALLAAPQKKDAPELWLQAAIQAETVDGDWRSAIEQYKKIIGRSDAGREVVAKALVRLGLCYERQGSAEARKQYERVIREFSDQKEAAALARERLGGAGTAARVKVERAVWTGPKVDLFGKVSPDGRWITYIDWTTGSLCLHDLQSGADHILTKGWADAAGQHAEFSTFSRDGKQVAYGWNNGKDRYELRTAALLGTSLGQPRRVFDNEEVKAVAPYDWSPDGKWVAVHLTRKDLSGQIALVGIPEGALRVLKSVDWRGPSKIFFSPDSNYIAFDLPVGDTSEQTDVFVMAIDGSRESAAVAHPSRDIVMGWSPDGKHLLFASDRTGSVGLWAQPVAEGKPQRAPELLKPDLGSSWSLGLTSAGALYVFKGVSNRRLQVAPIDLQAGKLAGAPATVSLERFGHAPDWSPDGKYLTAVSCGPTGGGPCVLHIRSMETGQVREVRPKLWYMVEPRWAPDGRSFVTAGRDLKGRDGIYRFDAQTGDTTPVVLGPRLGSYPQWSPDGNRIYYRHDGALLEREWASGKEREVIRRGGLGRLSVSPDGRYASSPVAQGAYSEASILLLIPITGGEPREIRLGHLGSVHGWTSDSRAVLVLRRPADKAELWLVPVAEGEPRKLDIDASDWPEPRPGFRLHPDGRRIAFMAGKSIPEVWALENFLPDRSVSK